VGYDISIWSSTLSIWSSSISIRDALSLWLAQGPARQPGVSIYMRKSHSISLSFSDATGMMYPAPPMGGLTVMSAKPTFFPFAIPDDHTPTDQDSMLLTDRTPAVWVTPVRPEAPHCLFIRLVPGLLAK